MNGKVELRQLSARDEARLTGGIGSCGRELCCATFLVDFEPVSVRMAKDQDLPLNPLRIAGACGRLMCCLKYEHPLYQEFAEQAPAIGASVETPDGDGTVRRAQRAGREGRRPDGGRRTGEPLRAGRRVLVAQGIRLALSRRSSRGPFVGIA